MHSYGHVFHPNPGFAPTLLFSKNATLTYDPTTKMYVITYATAGAGVCITSLTSSGTPNAVNLVGFSAANFAAEVVADGVVTTGSFTFMSVCS